MQNRDVLRFYLRIKDLIDWSTVDANTKVLLRNITKEIVVLVERMQKSD